ncbi:MAG: peptidyl-prolyl cis-trans isomerase [Nitrospirota bacterium]
MTGQWIWRVALAAIVLLGVADVRAAVAERTGRAVAEVGNQSIAVETFEARLAAERKRAVAENRVDAFGSPAKRKLLDQLVETKLFAINARAAGLDQRPDVKRKIEEAVDDVLARAMRDDVAASLDLSQPALRAYYDAHPGEFEVPGRVRARHVVVKTRPEAVALLGKLKRGADVAALAREQNIDSTRESGGDLGWVKRGVMVAPFETALFALHAGELSPVVQTSYGFHVIKAEEIESPKPKPFDAVAGEIRETLIAKDVERLRAELATRHRVTVHEEALKSIR